MANPSLMEQGDGPPDADVVAIVLAGNPEAFGVIIRRYEPGLLRFATRMLGSRDAAADAVAEGLRAPYALGDTQELQRLLEQAGLPNATITTHPGTARFPSIRAWMYTDIKGWALADLLDDAQFEQLVDAAQHELGQFVIAGGSVEFAAPAHIIAASTPVVAKPGDTCSTRP